ncbi:MAG: alanine--glyoxylate aminotransferase family protein [Sulfolobales archaeon]|nr:alanine--glyoxylate aminotransferase family protein [Sulfolobales archaeon]MDW8082390.1 alanine--glyoxylate aminotransferase family protein [Sulfolobales archaeon]
MTRFLLMIPGPSLVDPETMLDMAKPTLSHVSADFDTVHKESLDMLKKVFRTEGSIVVIPGSGTAAIELAVRASVKPGERVVVLKAGYFAEYLADAARRIGASVSVVQSPIGRGFTEEDVEKILAEGSYSTILLQHVETSVAVANPVEKIAKKAKKFGAKVVVDGIASIGGMDMRLDEWGVDVCLTGSQKALAVPPGLAIVAFRKEFTPLTDSETTYFNISKLLKEMESTRNYYITPAVNLVYALSGSLKKILSEGLEARYRRHEILAKAVQRGLEALGLKLVAEEPFRAHTVTAAYIPEGVEWVKLYSEMRSRGIEIAGGLGELRGKIFRIGHMGEVAASDVIATLAALERSLARLGYRVELGSSLRAAQEALHYFGV